MKELGKLIGYCPQCGIALGEMEVGKECNKCGFRVDKSNLVVDSFIEISKQSLKQSAMARHYPGYSKEKKEINNGFRS